MPFKEIKNGKHTGRWIGKIVWDHEQIWCGRHDTKTEAKEAEDIERAKRLLAARSPHEVETCDSFAARWITDYARPRKTTNEQNKSGTRKFGAEFKGIPMREVDRPTARAWAIRNPHALPAVRAMFFDAMNDGLVSVNPFSQLKIAKPIKRQKTIDILSEEQMESLVHAALRAFPARPGYGEEFRAQLILGSRLGCRPGEFRMIKPMDFEKDLSMVRIYEQRTKHNEVTDTKTSDDRLLVVAPEAQDAIRPYMIRPRDQPLFRGIQGKPLTAGSQWYAWSKVCTLWGRPGLDLYEVTRHYCATMLIHMGLSPQEVAVHLGHDDGGREVMRTYYHPDRARARDRIRKAFEDRAVSRDNVVPIRKVAEK